MSGIALVVSITAAISARRSARAATANAAIAARAEQRALDDRDDADGPTFTADRVVVHDRKAKIKLRMSGGPGEIAVEVRSAGVPFLNGLSLGEADPIGESVWFPPTESGEVLTLTAHLSVDVWSGHADGHPMALLCDVQSREERPRRWDRRVTVQLMPPPPAPLSA